MRVLQRLALKVHIPCQIPNIVVQSIENQGVGYPEREK